MNHEEIVEKIPREWRDEKAGISYEINPIFCVFNGKVPGTITISMDIKIEPDRNGFWESTPFMKMEKELWVLFPVDNPGSATVFPILDRVSGIVERKLREAFESEVKNDVNQ